MCQLFKIVVIYIIPICLTSLNLEAQITKSDLRNKRQIRKFERKSRFVYIDGGDFTIRGDDEIIGDPLDQDLYFEKINHVEPFFIAQFEVTNEEYLTFLNDIKLTSVKEYEYYLPDTSLWILPSGLFDHFTSYYLRDNYYKYFPVIGVSMEMAIRYSNWCTEKYNSDEDRIFQKVHFRLPTEAEWCFAASGGNDLEIYPWGGLEAVNEDGSRKGNYQLIRDLALLQDTTWMRLGKAYHLSKEDSSMVSYIMEAPNVPFFDEVSIEATLPVRSFEENAFQLYNMGGNVEEMVLDVPLYPIREVLVTKGGSWKDSGYETLIFKSKRYDDINFRSIEIGFRLVMEVVEY